MNCYSSLQAIISLSIVIKDYTVPDTLTVSHDNPS